MTARPGDGVHRSVLTVVALVMVVGSVAGLLVSYGALGPGDLQRRPVFENPVGRDLGRNSAWSWPVLGLVGLVVAFLALRWLLVNVSSPRARELDLATDRRAGRTLVSPGAVTTALTDEITSYHGVRSASARWLGEPRDPQLHLSVTHTHDLDVVELLDRVEQGALAHLRQALDRDDIPVRLDLSATSRS